MAYHPTENNLRLFYSEVYSVITLIRFCERARKTDVTVRSNRQTLLGLLNAAVRESMTENVELPAGEIIIFTVEDPWSNLIPDLSNFLANTRETGKSKPITAGDNNMNDNRESDVSSDALQGFKEKVKSLTRWLTANPMPESMYTRGRMAQKFAWN